jgi:hypothetical protein
MKSYDEWKLSNPWDDDDTEPVEEREAREDVELLINECKQEDRGKSDENERDSR